jgi:hypothetical protein
MRVFARSLVQRDPRGWKTRVDALHGVAPESGALGRMSGELVRQHSIDLKAAVTAAAAGSDVPAHARAAVVSLAARANPPSVRPRQR